MQNNVNFNPNAIARWTGLGLLAAIIVGIFASVFVAQGIDINLSGDVKATAENMLAAETRVRLKAYLALLTFALQALVSVGFYLLLRQYRPLLAGTSLYMSLGAAILVLMGAVYAMNVAQFASHTAYQELTNDPERLFLTGLQATSDYTSFHLALALSSIANAGFFYGFLKSRLIPKLMAGWGVFANIFVSAALIIRDFVPMVGDDAVTISFMICNLAALIIIGLYLSLRGVRGA